MSNKTKFFNLLDTLGIVVHEGEAILDEYDILFCPDEAVGNTATYMIAGLLLATAGNTDSVKLTGFSTICTDVFDINIDGEVMRLGFVKNSVSRLYNILRSHRDYINQADLDLWVTVKDIVVDLTF